MHPYRDAPDAVEAAPRPPHEERVLYLALVAFGVLPVAFALIRGGAFGTDATVGAILAIVGVAGLTRRS